MTTKLEELQRDIERLDQISDEQVAAEEASVRKLAEVRLKPPRAPLTGHSTCLKAWSLAACEHQVATRGIASPETMQSFPTS